MRVIKTDNMRVPLKIWDEGVPMEVDCIKQMEKICELPFVQNHAALMPDGHTGIGGSVGSVVATVGAICPSIAGVDLGCGMVAVKTSLKAGDLPDDIKHIRTAIEAAVPVGFAAHDENHSMELYNHKYCDGLYNRLSDINEKHNISNGTTWFRQLGTLGGGNHFIELCLDDQNYGDLCYMCNERRSWDGCGTRLTSGSLCSAPNEGNIWIMLHSGSRGIGNKIGSYFIDLARKDMETYFINLPNRDLAYIPENTEHFKDYMEAVGFAQDYAAENRRLMLQEVIAALKTTKLPPFTLEEEAINCHHNYIAKESHYGRNMFVTRKGAIRARKGDMGIIPGSMHTNSFIVRGKGNPDSFTSCSHGAGRKMSRTKAREMFSLEDHIKASKGVECRLDKDVIDETGAAYKDIQNVMAAQSDLVEIVYKLKQFLCVKG